MVGKNWFDGDKYHGRIRKTSLKRNKPPKLSFQFLVMPPILWIRTLVFVPLKLKLSTKDLVGFRSWCKCRWFLLVILSDSTSTWISKKTPTKLNNRYETWFFGKRIYIYLHDVSFWAWIRPISERAVANWVNIFAHSSRSAIPKTSKQQQQQQQQQPGN